MTDYVQKNKQGILLGLIGVTITVITLMITKEFNTYDNETNIIASSYVSNVFMNEPESAHELTEEELLEELLNNNNELIVFLANTFQIDINVFKDILRNNYVTLDLLNQTNLPYFLTEYLLQLENTDNYLFTKTRTGCTDNKDYIVALVKYFCSIYSTVDFSIAAAIADIESNYSAPGMLASNNIFGGMYGGGLIRYKNIEYGVLKYIKLLNDGYFSKGLNTVASIGLVYNPTFNENGVKIAKPSWVNNVTNSLNKYYGYNEVDITQLKLLKNT